MFRLNYWTRPSFYPVPGPPGMNRGFLPNPHGLMVFSPNSDNIRQDSDRMQGNSPYSTGQNMPDGKDIISTPYTTTSYSMYPAQGDPFPPPLYAPMHPPVLRPNLDRSVGILSPGGGGAFRPVPSSNNIDSSPSSAFSLTKQADHNDRTIATLLSNGSDNAETDEGRSPGQPQQQQQQSGVKDDQTACVQSPSRPASIDSSSDVHSEGADSADRSTPDEGRILRREY